MGVFNLWNSLSCLYSYVHFFENILHISKNLEIHFVMEEREFSVIHSKYTSNEVFVVTETIVKLRP